jgi:uncharacterized RDD family membrane protein YckC
MSDSTQPQDFPAQDIGAGSTPEPMTRFIAFIIDAVAVGLVNLIPLVGGVVGIGYTLFRDGLDVEYMRRRSLGKTLMKITVVRDDGAPMDLATSARRNWPLAFGSLAAFLIYIPVLGWILVPFVLLGGLVLAVIEAVRVFQGQPRLGDTWAATRVVTAEG